MKEKEESEKVGLKINIQKTKIMAPRLISSVLFSSVAQLCTTLCDPMSCSMPGLLVHQQLLEFTQTHSIESVMPSSHFILCRPLLLLPLIPPRIRVYSNESTLRMRWPKYWSFSFSLIASKEISGLIFRMDWLDLLAIQGTLKSLLQHHSPKASILWRSALFTIQLSHPYIHDHWCWGPALVDPGNSKWGRRQRGETYLFRDVKKD